MLSSNVLLIATLSQETPKLDQKSIKIIGRWYELRGTGYLILGVENETAIFYAVVERFT